MLEFNGPHLHAVGKIGSHLHSHDLRKLSGVCKDYRDILSDQLQPESFRSRVLAEKRDIIESFIEKLDDIHISTAEAIGERLGTLGTLRPATRGKLISSIYPDQLQQGLYPTLSRDVLPALRREEIEPYFRSALSCPDSYRKYVGLSSLGHAAEHLPKDALPALRAEVALTNDAWKEYVFSSVGQLARGFSGSSENEQGLRHTLIAEVFGMPADSRSARAPKAALAGLWPHLNTSQRRSVTQATTQLLQFEFGADRFSGLGYVNTRSHDVSLRASTQAFGDIVHTLPEAERSAFFQALHKLPEDHFAQTVDMLGANFHEQFPATFLEARRRVQAHLAHGNLELHEVPIRMRPHEAIGVPRSLKSDPAYMLADRPALTYRELLDSTEPAPLTADETKTISEGLADEENCRAILRYIGSPLGFHALSKLGHIGVFSPENQIAVIDILASTDALHRVDATFFSGIDARAEKALAAHVKRSLAANANAGLPPMPQLSDALRDELSTSEFARWKAASQVQNINQRQLEIARRLDAGLPDLHARESLGLDAWLEGERQQWLAGL